VKTDPWKAILHETDGASELPVASADLAGRIIRRARRRRQVRRAAATGVAAILIFGWWLLPRERSEPIQRTVAIRENPASIQKLDAQDRMAELTAEMDLSEGIAPRASATEPKVDPMDRMDQDVDESVAVLIDSGDRISREPGEQAEAAEIYRSVAKYFPATHWATVAESRLRELKS
jgi:hypothetical protein